jgi:hypothetical protein
MVAYACNPSRRERKTERESDRDRERERRKNKIISQLKAEYSFVNLFLF